MTPTSSTTTALDDPLTDFVRHSITLLDTTRVVHVGGSGPAVIVLAEMPGISPHVARFSRWVRDAGFTVYMPSLFGRDGAFPTAEEGTAVLQRACMAAEFSALAADTASPITAWLRALEQQQMRAVCGLTLGDPTQHTPAVMINLLGDVWPGEKVHPDWSPVLSHPRAKLHLYGKAEARAKRKMGHITVLGDTLEEALETAAEIKKALGIGEEPQH